MNLSESAQVMVLLIGCLAVETVFLLAILMFFESPPPGPTCSVATPGPPTDDPLPEVVRTIRSVGFVERFGILLGGAICFAVLFALTMTIDIPGGAFLWLVGWCVAALTLFRLTVRQTLKATIAFGLFNLALKMAIGLMVGGR